MTRILLYYASYVSVMKEIISFDGINKIGKTTQASRLCKANGGLIHIMNDISDYSPILQQEERELYNWWFVMSTPQEFCDTIYTAIREQMDDIVGISAPFILLDKGIITYDARVNATLQMKGLTEEEAFDLIASSKAQVGYQERASLSIFFSHETKNVFDMIPKNFELGFSSEQNEKYCQYQRIIQTLMHNSSARNKCTCIAANSRPDIITEKILAIIVEHVSPQFYSTFNGKKIYGLSGFSEAGKSTIGYILDKHHSIWDLKLTYLLRKISERYRSDDPHYCDQELIALLLCEEIGDFLTKHYYKQEVSIESIHTNRLAMGLKKILGDRYETLFVSTDNELRIKRAHSNSLCPDASCIIGDITLRDEEKARSGQNDISTDSNTHLLTNNSTLYALRNRLIPLVFSYETYCGEVLKTGDVKCPATYKREMLAFIDSINELLGEDLSLLLLTGGCYHATVVDRFSDIDFLIVCDHYNNGVLKEVKSLATKSMVKIGFTIWSSDAVRHGHIDQKTRINLMHLIDGKILPIIYRKDMAIPKYTRFELMRNDWNELPNIITRIRMLIINGEGDSLIKEMALLFKIVLLPEGYDLHGYDAIFTAFALTYEVPKYDISEYINDRTNKVKRECFLSYCEMCLKVVTPENR